MRMQITVSVDREILVWAAWYCANHGHPQANRKDHVMEFLRGQIAQFGTSSDTLMGSSAREDMDDSPNDVEKAEARVSKWFPGMEE